MLNKIILSIIDQNISKSHAMSSDIFEKPTSYKGWIYPIRFLLALRYLKLKKLIIAEFRFQKVYPISDISFRDELIKRLSNNQFTHKNALKINERANTTTKNSTSQKTSFTSCLLKANTIYPILIIVLFIVIHNTNQWHKQKRLESVFANHLPYFSELLHRKLLIIHNSNNDELLKKTDLSITQTENEILSRLPTKNGVRKIMKQQLNMLKDTTTNSEQIMLGFKDVNTLFDQVNLPYYLSPKSFSMPCSSLIDVPNEELVLLKELESLMSNDNPELCRTTMMTSYKVDDRTELFYDDKQEADIETELPLFHVRRIDKVPAVDSALGLTFKDRGIGSIILVDQIKDFAQESILPALTFQGREYIIPYWMQGHYEIEEAVTKGYKKDIEQIYTDKEEQRQIKNLIKELIKNKDRMGNAKTQQTMQRTNGNNATDIFGNSFDAISVLLGKNKNSDTQKKDIHKKEFQGMSFDKNNELTLKLDNILYPSIEYHEAYHQINKKQWQKPTWLDSTFDNSLDEYAIDHTLEELGAYLAQLANTDKGQNIWLSKLLIFSLNPMTQGQAEYYASSIIFNAMSAINSQKPIQASYEATVDQKTQTFKMLLTKNNKEISKMARQAYQVLFHREVPILLNKPSKNSFK